MKAFFGSCNFKVTLLIIVLTTSSVNASFWGLDWVWSNTRSDSEEPKSGIKIDGVTLVKVPFEAKTEDEKFLEEAKKYTSLKLSDLDTCQHKVVMKIRTSCSELTEEELAKLSVNLLNCQSAVEGRQQFPCTEHMTLRQCTSSMDSDMWNTYHLMSNRARAVCYAARHQQFRALSEMTVNKLMNTAHDQIAAMNTLKEGQEKLQDLTAGTLDAVAVGQESLLKQQERMRVTQQNLRDFVSLNLRQLTKEKALISAGHQELAKLTEDVKAKLDAASSQLIIQATERQENQMEILKDLRAIQDKANMIWTEIERSTQEILAHHELAAKQYEDTLLKLAKINNTVTFLLQLMETTRMELDERLSWLSSVVGSAGIYVFFLHGLYLLVGMIAASFLQAPPLTRLCLILIVPLNLSVICYQGIEASLNFLTMTVVIVISAAVHYIISNIRAYIARRKKQYNFQSQPVANGFSTKLPSSPMQASLHSKAKMWWMYFTETFSHLIMWCKTHSYLRMSLSDNTPADPGLLNSWKEVSQPLDHGDEDSSDNESCLQFDSGSERRSLIEDFSRQRQTGSSILRHRISPTYPFQSPPTPSRSSSRSGTPLHSGTPRPSCRALCRSGLLCRNSATPGSDVCRVHSADTSVH